MEKITATELVKRVLSHPDGSVDELLKIANKTETEWLELKAAINPRFEVIDGRINYILDSNEHIGDQLVSVVQAVIALANTNGGVVLLGISNELEAVGLEASDMKSKLKEGWDSFSRDVLQPAIEPVKRSWCCGKDGLKKYSISAGSLTGLIEYQCHDYKGKRIAAIIVSPVNVEDTLITVEELPATRDVWYVRSKGDIGKTETLHLVRDRDSFYGDRNPSQEKYANLWIAFERSIDNSIMRRRYIDKPAFCDLEVSKYIKLVKQSDNYKILKRVFTELTANEEEFIPTDFEPEAIENYIDDDLSEYMDDEDPDMDSEDGDEEDDFEQDSDEEEQYDATSKRYGLARSGGVFFVMDMEPRLVLLGEPGGGKTTSLLRKWHHHIDTYVETEILPIYLTMSKYKLGDSIFDLIHRHYQFSERTLLYMFNENRVMLLLDAINECRESYQASLINQISSMLSMYPELRLIITTRQLNWNNPVNLPTFTIKPMSKDQQLQFLEAYLKDGDLARSILEQLHKQPGGELIANNPWMLRMVASVGKKTKKLPEGRASLYYQYIMDWIERENVKIAKSGEEPIFTKEMAFHTLVTIAGILKLAGYNRSAPLDEACSILQPQSEQLDHFLHFYSGGLILLCSKDDNNLSFFHETIHEYLTAEYIITQEGSFSDKQFTSSRLSSNSMGMVTAYCLEILSTRKSIGENDKRNIIEFLWNFHPLMVTMAFNDYEYLNTLPVPSNLDYVIRNILSSILGVNIDIFMDLQERDVYQSVKNSSAFRQENNEGGGQIQVVELATELKVSMRDLMNYIKCLGVYPRGNKGMEKRFINQDVANIIRTNRETISLQNNDIKGQIRVHELAKELKISTMALKKHLLDLGITTKSHMSYINQDIADIIRTNRDKIPRYGNYLNLFSYISSDYFSYLSKINSTNKEKYRELISIVLRRYPLATFNSIKDGALPKSDLSSSDIDWLTNKYCNGRDGYIVIDLFCMGLISKKEIHSCVRKLSINPSFETICSLVSNNLVDPNTFHNFATKRLKKANDKQVELLLSIGVLDFDSVQGRIQCYSIETATEIQKLRLGSLIDVTRYKDQIPIGATYVLLNTSTVNPNNSVMKKISMLHNTEFVQNDPIKQIIAKWINNSTPKRAKLLIDGHLATKEDFMEMIPNWIENLSIKQAKFLLDVGLITKEDCLERLDIWKSSAITDKQQRRLLSFLSVIQPEKMDSTSHMDGVDLTSKSTQIRNEAIEPSSQEYNAFLDVSQLESEASRDQIKNLLVGLVFEGNVYRMGSTFGFIKCKMFRQLVFFHFDHLTGDSVFLPKDVVQFTANIVLNKKTQTYGYAIKHLQIVEQSDKTLYNKFYLESLLGVLLRAAKGKISGRDFQEFLDRFNRKGYDLNEFDSWFPKSEDINVLEMVKSVFDSYVAPFVTESAVRYEDIQDQLNAIFVNLQEPHWVRLVDLIEETLMKSNSKKHLKAND